MRVLAQPPLAHIMAASPTREGKAPLLPRGSSPPALKAGGIRRHSLCMVGSLGTSLPSEHLYSLEVS